MKFKQIVLLLCVVITAGALTSFSSTDESSSMGSNITKKIIQQDGMRYMVISQNYSNDGGVTVVNLTLDKAKLNYFKSQCD